MFKTNYANAHPQLFTARTESSPRDVSASLMSAADFLQRAKGEYPPVDSDGEGPRAVLNEMVVNLREIAQSVLPSAKQKAQARQSSNGTAGQPSSGSMQLSATPTLVEIELSKLDGLLADGPSAPAKNHLEEAKGLLNGVMRALGSSNGASHTTPGTF